MNYIQAFLTGGFLCAIGQILIDKTKLTPARILVIYVVAGVILQTFGLYQPLVDFGGAGATVPLTGFGYSLANGVKKAVTEQGFVGIFTGGLTATAGGISAVLLFGVVASLVSKSKEKQQNKKEKSQISLRFFVFYLVVCASTSRPPQ